MLLRGKDYNNNDLELDSAIDNRHSTEEHSLPE
jgi:hypothetical protein